MYTPKIAVPLRVCGMEGMQGNNYSAIAKLMNWFCAEFDGAFVCQQSEEQRAERTSLRFPLLSMVDRVVKLLRHTSCCL